MSVVNKISRDAFVVSFKRTLAQVLLDYIRNNFIRLETIDKKLFWDKGTTLNILGSLIADEDCAVSLEQISNIVYAMDCTISFKCKPVLELIKQKEKQPEIASVEASNNATPVSERHIYSGEPFLCTTCGGDFYKCKHIPTECSLESKEVAMERRN